MTERDTKVCESNIMAFVHSLMRDQTTQPQQQYEMVLVLGRRSTPDGGSKVIWGPSVFMSMSWRLGGCSGANRPELRSDLASNVIS